jgi:hypothetical protein
MRASLLGRRQLLRLAAVTVAAEALPNLGCYSQSGNALPLPGYLTADEKTSLAALANVVLPRDDQPGGADLGVVPFVQTLLAAFDSSPPTIYAGGPYSGRQPFADDHGAPSANYPPNGFATFLPLDRVKEAAWRLRLYGSSGVPGGGPNDAILGETVGLRDRMRKGLAAARDLAQAPLDSLSPDAIATVFEGLDADFQDLLIQLVAQAAFAAPEYGGNTNLAGWKMVHFVGDSQPLGFSLYDVSAGAYRERPDAPMSTPDPTPDPEPMDADTLKLIGMVVDFAGGKSFP